MMLKVKELQREQLKTQAFRREERVKGKGIKRKGQKRQPRMLYGGRVKDYFYLYA
jgi:hypothetical protein